MSATIQFKNRAIRKPKLAPTRTLNPDHIKYINDRASEQRSRTNVTIESVFSRPSSVPGSIIITDDNQEPRQHETLENIPDPEQVTSRPSTRNTIKDGIILRWESDDKLLLRRPRTSALFITPRRNSAKLSRARFGVAMTRTKAKGIVNSITQATVEAKHGKTAAQLCLEQSTNLDNSQHEHKRRLLRQYYLWNGDKMQLPALDLGRGHTAVNRTRSRYTSCGRDGSANRALSQLYTSNGTRDINMLRSNQLFTRGASYTIPRDPQPARAILRTEVMPIIEQIRLAIGDLL